MAMKCPKCQHPIAKVANGRYPARCPGCRVALRIVPSGENVAPEKAEDGHRQAKGPHFGKKGKQAVAARSGRRNAGSDEQSEEQVRRRPAKRASRFDQYENEPEEDELDDFDSRRRSRSVERPSPRQRRDEDDDLDDEYSTKKRRRSKRKFVDDEGSIFGTTRFQNRSSSDDDEDSVYFWPACLIVLVAVCLTGFVFRDTLMDKLRSDKPAPAASLQSAPESDFQSLAAEELPQDRADAHGKSRAIAGKKYPYQIVVGKSWKENDRLQGSLLADLKLISADHHATVIVSAAKNTTAEDRLRKFIHRKEKQFDKVTLQTPADGEPAEVAGWPALRIAATVESDVVKSDVVTSVYFKAGEYVYEIECRTPAERLQQFESEFAEIIRSFKSLDANPPAELVVAPAVEVRTDEPEKSTDSASENPSKQTETSASKKETADDAVKSTSVPPRNMGPKGDVRDTRSGKSAAAKTRVSLDDLD